MRSLFLMIMVVASISQGADTVMSDFEGNIVEPAKSVFFKKNIQSFRQDVRIFVDTSPSPASDSMTSANYSRSNPFYYKENGSTTRTVNSSGITMATFSDYYQYYDMCWWSDGEIKGIDKWGNLIYFTSTIGLNFSEVKALHPEITDEAPTIYYWSTYYNSTGGCWGTKRQLTEFGYIRTTILLKGAQCLFTREPEFWIRQIFPKRGSATIRMKRTQRPAIDGLFGENTSERYF